MGVRCIRFEGEILIAKIEQRIDIRIEPKLWWRKGFACKLQISLIEVV